MHTKSMPSPRLRGSARRTAALALAAAAAALSLGACQSGGAQAAGGSPPAGPQKLLWMGDSIAEAQAPALGAAMQAAGVEFESMAAAGGGGLLGPPPIVESTKQKLSKLLTSFAPDVVAYQLTTYDWGAPAEQRAGYEQLAEAVTGAGAELVLVTAPPFKVTDFYKPHAGEIKTAPEAAKQVAAEHAGTVHFLDASALWGTDHTAAEAQRSEDGIHSCQQGSAAFATWFGKRLQKVSSFAPAPVEEWATGPWTGEKLYTKLGCA